MVNEANTAGSDRFNWYDATVINFYGAGFKNQNPCLACSTSPVLPGVEIAHRYYANATTGYLRGLRDPYEVPSDNTFLGFTTYTHRLVP